MAAEKGCVNNYFVKLWSLWLCLIQSDEVGDLVAIICSGTCQVKECAQLDFTCFLLCSCEEHLCRKCKGAFCASDRWSARSDSVTFFTLWSRQPGFRRLLFQFKPPTSSGKDACG